MRRLLPLLALLLTACPAERRRTALDEYIAAPDPAYRWESVRTIDGDGYTAHFLRMTSQTWRTEGEVDRTEWWHWLIVVVPDEVRYRTGLLVIDGGSNGGDAPDAVSPLVTTVALQTHSIVSHLRMVPNQPLELGGEGRREDALIAYSWRMCMETGDTSWLAQLPMVKSAVRAMDTAQEVTGALDSFVIMGGSKRGWTTWLTAAVDPRVTGIIPVVIDVLNMRESMRHHHACYGFWSEAIHDYVEQGITDHLDSDEIEPLRQIVDPYEYRDRLTMPKYIVNASGDEFFVLDSSQFYYDDLEGENRLRYVPNTGHGIASLEAGQAMFAWYEALLNGTPRPQYSWTFEADGSIRVEMPDAPSAARVWHATNPDARDFRFRVVGGIFESEPLEDQGGGVYVARVEPPERGWTAFYVELEFPSGGAYPFVFSTAVRVVPDVLPHE